jgi:hypothetical protein
MTTLEKIFVKSYFFEGPFRGKTHSTLKTGNYPHSRVVHIVNYLFNKKGTWVTETKGRSFFYAMASFWKPFLKALHKFFSNNSVSNICVSSNPNWMFFKWPLFEKAI